MFEKRRVVEGSSRVPYKFISADEIDIDKSKEVTIPPKWSLVECYVLLGVPAVDFRC